MDKETHKAILLKELIENYRRSHRNSEEIFKNPVSFLFKEEAIICVYLSHFLFMM
ncbi:MAG: hypothetical protein IBX60_05180 [Candidatus Aminicenantes bacterium]|nr:hypothetical protein [Candidatus Aminicenantes bacterium]